MIEQINSAIACSYSSLHNYMNFKKRKIQREHDDQLWLLIISTQEFIELSMHVSAFELFVYACAIEMHMLSWCHNVLAWLDYESMWLSHKFEFGWLKY